MRSTQPEENCNGEKCCGGEAHNATRVKNEETRPRQRTQHVQKPGGRSLVQDADGDVAGARPEQAL